MNDSNISFLAYELAISKSEVLYKLKNNHDIVLATLIDIIGEEANKIEENYDHDDTRITMAENTISKVFRYVEQKQ